MDNAGLVAPMLDRSMEDVHRAPGFERSMEIATDCRRLGQRDEAYGWLRRAAGEAENFLQWQAAALAFKDLRREGAPGARRTARVALLGSYTTSQLALLLGLAAFREGIDIDIYESGYGQYSQDLIDPDSELYAFRPEVVILAVHEGALGLPEIADDPDAAVGDELERWRQLWALATRRASARVIQHTFVTHPAQPLGHLAGRLGSRYAMAEMLNARMMREAPAEVAFVDCERLASWCGKQAWFNERYWYLTRQALAPEAVPLLARHTAAVLAATLGLNRKCLVLDLDGTLWGGVIGEDGLGGITLGGGPAGEAYADFQSFLLGLKQKGILLAVASRNNDFAARLPFEKHPDTRLRLADFAAFVAGWNDKVSDLREIGAELGLGLDSLVMVDDSPAECAQVRAQLPEVDVVELPSDPVEYVRTLTGYLGLETVALTDEDTRRTEQYLARREAGRLEAATGSLTEFHRSLEMSAQLMPLDEQTMPRVAQLIAKTNQFNLTGLRPGLAELDAIARDPSTVHVCLRLRDRFGDHGLVSVLVGRQDGDAVEVEVWVMSCRVLGRTVEAKTLEHLCREAAGRGCRRLRGTHVPTARNQLVRDLYGSFGFELVADAAGTTTWEFDLSRMGPIRNDLIAEE
jgi:FkbH-like protein